MAGKYYFLRSGEIFFGILKRNEVPQASDGISVAQGPFPSFEAAQQAAVVYWIRRMTEISDELEMCWDQGFVESVPAKILDQVLDSLNRTRAAKESDSWS